MCSEWVGKVSSNTLQSAQPRQLFTARSNNLTNYSFPLRGQKLCKASQAIISLLSQFKASGRNQKPRSSQMFFVFLYNVLVSQRLVKSDISVSYQHWNVSFLCSLLKQYCLIIIVISEGWAIGRIYRPIDDRLSLSPIIFTRAMLCIY